MPTRAPVFSPYHSQSQPNEITFQPEQWLADIGTPRGDEGKRIVEAAEKIIRRYYEYNLRQAALMGNKATITNYNGDFEADVDEPMTLESLAEQQKKFLAANEQDWEDIDLPSPFK